MQSHCYFVKRALITLSMIIGVGVSASAETPELQQHVIWSIAHEGCRPYTKSDARSRADTFKPAADLRACYLDAEKGSPEVSRLLESATDAEITSLTTRAIGDISAAYHIAENFEWVLDHEGQREVIQELDRAGDFDAIRALYEHYQSHNPNARNVLSALSDSELHALINRKRITVSVNKNVSYDALLKLSSLAETKPFLPDSSMTLSEIAKSEYGGVSDTILKLIIDSNRSVFKKSSKHLPLNQTVAQGTALALPYALSANYVNVVPLKADAPVERVEAALLKTQTVTIEPTIGGAIEEPAPAHLTSAPNAADGYTDWFAKAVSADKISTADFGSVNNDIILGIIDGGVDTSQPDLASSFWRVPPELEGDGWTANSIGFDYLRQAPNPYDEMPDSHGTHVAGIASGRSLGIFIPAFQVGGATSHLKLAVMKVAGKDKHFDFSAAENAVEDAFGKGIHLFNLSLQGPPSRILHHDLSTTSTLNNDLFIIAAGNDTADLSANTGIHNTFRGVQSDALANVIFVAAFNDVGKIAKFSNYGNTVVQIAAPGVQIPSTLRNGGFGPLSGTSMAAPFVTMTAGLILAQKPTMPLPQVKKRILATCDFDPALEDSVIDGCRLNTAKAIGLNTDVLQLRSGLLLRGRVDPAQFTVMGPNNADVTLDVNVNTISRIWITDEGKTKVITSAERRSMTKLTNPKVLIQLDAGNTCPDASVAPDCVLETSGIRDVTFRLR